MTVLLNLEESALRQEILALQQAAYPYEAKLLGQETLPPMTETEEELAGCGETIMGLYHRGRLAALAGWTLEGRVLELCRMAVHPDFFRRGYASRLLGLAETAARAGGAVGMTVSTGRDNLAGVALYRRWGFVLKDSFLVPEGLEMVRLYKAL